MTSFIAAAGSGRSASNIPPVPAAWSVTTIAFIVGYLCVSLLAATPKSKTRMWRSRPWGVRHGGVQAFRDLDVAVHAQPSCTATSESQRHRYVQEPAEPSSRCAYRTRRGLRAVDDSESPEAHRRSKLANGC